MIFGYIRQPETGKPISQLQGVNVGKMFTDVCDCTTYARPQRDAMLSQMKAGDELHVESLDRLARDVNDLAYVLRSLVFSGVSVLSHVEGLLFDGTAGQRNATLASIRMVEGLAGLERRLQNERKTIGLARAKADGKPVGCPRTISPTVRDAIRTEAAGGASKATLARDFGVSRRQVYRILQEGRREADGE